jgi:hypothetical protein
VIGIIKIPAEINTCFIVEIEESKVVQITHNQLFQIDHSVIEDDEELLKLKWKGTK